MARYDFSNQTIDNNGERQQQRTTDRTMQMFSPRLEYAIDDTQKLVADLFYRNTKSDGTRQDQIQKIKMIVFV